MARRDRSLTTVLATWLGALACWALALWPRLRDLDATMALADTIGPFLTAADPGRGSHAPPFGWGLYLPYWLALRAGSLTAALGLIAALHALTAPLGFLAVRLLRPRAWGAAIAVGALLALDRGLLDTTLSGAEGYLAATWLAATTLGLAGRERAWGPWVAAGAWAMAVLNHPFALAAAPLLLLLPLRRASLGAMLLAGAMLAPRVLAALSGPMPEAEGDPLAAPAAWLAQGGAGSVAVLLGAAIGLLHRQTRWISLATMASAALMLLLGIHLGYLRDHHLRLLSAPALVGMAALPGAWGALALALLRPPPSWLPQPGHPHRPGTLGLERQLADTLDALPGPVQVDGAWLSGTPAAEPAALLLDLHLRGHALGSDTLTVLVSAERGRWEGLPLPGRELPGRMLDRGDRHLLVVVDPADRDAWAPALCERGARIGGAVEGMGALAPDAPVRPWECGG